MKIWKSPIAVYVVVWLAECCFLAPPVQATEGPKNIEALIVTHKWQEASRSIFREASAVDAKESSIAVNQAKVGFIDDAILNAQLQFPVVRTPLLLEIAKNAPSLSVNKKNDLVRMALENARTDIGHNYLRSGDLALLSLTYLEKEQEPMARVLFEEAMNVAERGLNEQGSGGYRRISEQLATADLKVVRDWMISPLVKLIDSTRDPFNAAFTYVDLARFQFRLNRRDAARSLLNSGINAAKKVVASGSKAAAVDGLTKLALEMGEVDFAERYGNRSRLLPSYAAFEAEKGHRAEALALVSQLSNGLYVGWKSETQAELVSEAVKRRDLDAATFYAERLTDCPTSVEMKAWTQIAELHAAQGERKAAQESYGRARDSMKKKREHEYYSFEVKATVALGTSMFQNGFVSEGRSVISTAVQQMKTIPGTRVEDRVSVQVKIAQALSSMGIIAEATELLSEAYRDAHAYPQSESSAQMRKASLLSEIALVAAMMPRAKSK